jgi:hypothetical protein
MHSQRLAMPGLRRVPPLHRLNAPVLATSAELA